jgi:hypothetical protein
VGLLLTLLGVAFMASGSALLGLLLAVLGVMLLFNLWGLWLLVVFVTFGAGIVLRHRLRMRRQARVART